MKLRMVAKLRMRQSGPLWNLYASSLYPRDDAMEHSHRRRQGTRASSSRIRHEHGLAQHPLALQLTCEERLRKCVIAT